MNIHLTTSVFFKDILAWELVQAVLPRNNLGLRDLESLSSLLRNVRFETLHRNEEQSIYQKATVSPEPGMCALNGTIRPLQFKNTSGEVSNLLSSPTAN